MSSTTGRLVTQNGSKYLQQLCKHFGHKLDAEFTETTGEIALPVGRTLLNATPEALVVQIELTDAAELARAHMIIDSHLERFAFREGFKSMEWVTEGNV